MIPRTSPPGSDWSDRSSKQEAQRALLEFYEEQTERAERRDQVRVTRSARLPPGVAAGLLSMVSLWLWLAPAAWLVPPPLPVPSPEAIEAGLRMDLYTTALAIERYEELQSALPTALSALDQEIDPDIAYERFAASVYRLVARRAGIEVLWDSTQPLAALLDGLPAGLQREGRR